MAHVKLTNRLVENKTPPKLGRLSFHDKKVQGLTFRITKEGSRSFSITYRFANKKARYTLGSVNKGMDLSAARDAARDAFELIRRGIDPRAAKAEAAAAVATAHATTFGGVADEYLKRYVEKNTRPKTQRETKRILDVDVKPVWGKRPISSITRADVAALLGTIGDKRKGKQARHGGEVQQNRTLTRLGTLFNWAVEKGYISTSPVAGMKKNYAEKPRDRALTDQELVWFWKGCEQLEWPWQQIFRLLLLTAQRRAEVGTMEWSELDLGKRVWTIPPAKSKNGKEHYVALAESVVQILAPLRKEAGRDPKGNVFTTTGKTPVSGYSRAKKRLDEKMEAVARKDASLLEDDEYRKPLSLDAGAPLPQRVPEWILHDLRRTATTGMARLKVPPHVADKILNHTSGTISGVAAVYNKFDYLDERRDALELWARYVMALLQPKKTKTNVVAFPG
jgi:integrase